MLSKMKLGNIQLIQIAKKTKKKLKLRDLLSGKCILDTKPIVVGDNLLLAPWLKQKLQQYWTSLNRHMTYGYSQSSQQKPKIKILNTF